jgi:hypothetical protein
MRIGVASPRPILEPCRLEGFAYQGDGEILDDKLEYSFRTMSRSICAFVPAQLIKG